MRNISTYVFGKRLEADVPERTRRDIADQQIESESLLVRALQVPVLNLLQERKADAKALVLLRQAMGDTGTHCKVETGIDVVKLSGHGND